MSTDDYDFWGAAAIVGFFLVFGAMIELLRFMTAP